MRQWRVGTFTMGVLLIALGVIMIIARMYGLPAIEHIINWWPVILIMLGLEILIFSVIPGQNESRISFDGFSVFMIIIIMIFSLGAYGATNFLKDITGLNIFNSLPQNSKYQSNFKKNITIESMGKDKIVLSNRFGNVQAIKGSGDNIEIQAEITIHNNDEDYAKQISDLIVDVSQTNPVRITSKRENYLSDRSKVQNININYILKVPEGMAVEIDNEYGKVFMEGIDASAKVLNKHGDVEIKRIGGELYVENSFARVELNEIKGKAEVHNKNGAMTVKGVGGSLIANNSYGSVEIAEVKGDTKVSNNNAKIKVENVEGKLSVDSKFCQVYVDGIKGNLEVKGNNGSMAFDDIGGDVKADNKYGSIELVNASKSVNLINTNGSIVFDSNKIVEKSVNIENQYGSVTIKVPKSQQGYYKANVRYGKISNEFNLSINKGNNEETLEGKVGEGAASFNLSNKNGDIKLQAK